MIVLRDRGLCEHIGFRTLVETEQRDFKASFYLLFTTKEGSFLKSEGITFYEFGVKNETF